jgi:hypothetical protein
MTTSGRVVPTALAASPDAPLPLESAAALLVDQQGRLLVNVAAAALTPTTKVLTALDLAGVSAPVAGAGTLQRATLAVYSGAGFMQLWNGAPGVGALLYTPIPIPTTLPAYIDVEFDTVHGLAFSSLSVAVSTTGPTYTAPAPGAATGTLTTSYT